MSKIEERLALVRYVVDTEAHIRVDAARCESCGEKPCLLCCPAECFTLEGGKIHHAYEGCLECGTCRLICTDGAVSWSNPRGGYGVAFRY